MVSLPLLRVVVEAPAAAAAATASAISGPIVVNELGTKASPTFADSMRQVAAILQIRNPTASLARRAAAMHAAARRGPPTRRPQPKHALISSCSLMRAGLVNACRGIGSSTQALIYDLSLANIVGIPTGFHQVPIV